MDLSDEIKYTFSRSGGKGGQNVNKVSTKVSLYFNVQASAHFNQKEKDSIAQKLDNRINREGVLILHCSKTRSQLKNKKMATKQLYELITQALKHRRPRIATKVSKGTKKKRLDRKKRNSEKKVNRRKIRLDNE